MVNRFLPGFTIAAFFLLGGVVLVTTLDSQPAAEEAEFVGQHTCMTSGCHSDEVGINHTYMQTMHARIHERPTPENVIIDRWFEIDTVLIFQGGRFKAENDTFKIALSKRGTPDEYYFRFYTAGPYSDSTDWHKIVYNYGGNGWLQRFLVEINGNLHVTPFQYVLESYGDREGDNGVTIPIDVNRWAVPDRDIGALRLMEPQSQEFYNQSWDKNCSGCHLNGYEVDPEFLPGGDTIWRASWPGTAENDSAVTDINIAIGCESCHGPGSLHVAEPENPKYFEDISPKRWDDSKTSRRVTDRKLDLCNQCHNRHKSTLEYHGFPYDDANGNVAERKPFLPRLDLMDFISDSLRWARFWPDRKTSIAHHQTGQDYWRSSHFEGHVFKDGCYDCHAVHENTEYPYQLKENYYTLDPGEGCVAFGCHADKAEATMINDTLVNTHSQHHQAHSQCVNCHYTKTATITFAGFYEFSDHSDKVIRPTETIKYRDDIRLGMPNTCAESCHRNGYGSRNGPDAFDRNASIRYSTGGTPMRAPDYGIVDKQPTFWKEASDFALADSLWEGYKRLYPEYVGDVSDTNEIPPVRRDSRFISVAPNPANGPVTIRYEIPVDESITVEVFNTAGERVALVSRRIEFRGLRSKVWDLRDDNGHVIPAGLYFLRIRGESFDGLQSFFVDGE